MLLPLVSELLIFIYLLLRRVPKYISLHYTALVARLRLVLLLLLTHFSNIASKQMHEDGDGTLASILAATSIYPESHVPCYQWKPNYKIITKAKR